MSNDKRKFVSLVKAGLTSCKTQFLCVRFIPILYESLCCSYIGKMQLIYSDQSLGAKTAELHFDLCDLTTCN